MKVWLFTGYYWKIEKLDIKVFTTKEKALSAMLKILRTFNFDEGASMEKFKVNENLYSYTNYDDCGQPTVHLIVKSQEVLND